MNINTNKDNNNQQELTLFNTENSDILTKAIFDSVSNTGLRILTLFLARKGKHLYSMRAISTMAGVSLCAVSKAMKQLKEKQFVREHKGNYYINLLGTVNESEHGCSLKLTQVLTNVNNNRSNNITNNNNTASSEKNTDLVDNVESARTVSCEVMSLLQSKEEYPIGSGLLKIPGCDHLSLTPLEAENLARTFNSRKYKVGHIQRVLLDAEAHIRGETLGKHESYKMRLVAKSFNYITYAMERYSRNLKAEKANKREDAYLKNANGISEPKNKEFIEKQNQIINKIKS